MKILVANLGSTSFKFRLFDMSDERQLARGGVERIGAQRGAGEPSPAFVEVDGRREEFQLAAPDHGAAIEACLTRLTDPTSGCLGSVADVAAVGFKTVHGGRISGVRRVDSDLLDAMTEMNAICPAHNPPYIAAMRQLSERMPGLALVAAFETGFHATIPERLRHYAVPYEWAEQFQLKRWGFHGASHRYVAERMRQLTGDADLRLVTCHLGGSSSVCASRAAQSVATSMGMSPQTGLPQNNRVGDFDAYALPMLAQRMGTSVDGVLEEMAKRGGLLGLSGISGDIRDLSEAAAAGEARAQLALDVFVGSIRHYLGAYLVELGGVDAIAFTAGIGENRTELRAAVCAGLEELGIAVDAARNAAAHGEGPIHATHSRTQIWI
ncbi:MAG TPA: acetate/propionate family kinase, partial [Lacipirellulaceae bacterium]|nr:acetate/propionate family kinase [Lacipirellulaceae bacterium]